MEIQDVELIRFEKLRHAKFLINTVQLRKEHIHREFEIFYVLDGEGKATINGKTYTISQGDMYLVNTLEMHSYSNKDPKEKTGLTFVFLQISNHFLYDYFPQIRTTMFQSGDLRKMVTEEEFSNLRRAFFLAAQHYFNEPKEYQIYTVSYISDILRVCYRKVPYQIISKAQKNTLKAKMARIERITSYIDANFESQIRLKDLADKENLSTTHFSHLFVSLFHMTFQDFVSLKRLEAAIRLMANKEKTMLEISYESGFSDPKYMNKMFIKHFGCTPNQYREQLGEQHLELTESSTEKEKIYSVEEARKMLNDYLAANLDLLHLTYRD